MRECLGTSVMSRYGRIRFGDDLLDHSFCQTKISVTDHFQISETAGSAIHLVLSCTF